MEVSKGNRGRGALLWTNNVTAELNDNIKKKNAKMTSAKPEWIEAKLQVWFLISF